LGYILGQFLNPVTLFGAKGVVDAAWKVAFFFRRTERKLLR
jgi:hypothetical protein